MPQWLVQRNAKTGRYIVQWRDGRSIRGCTGSDLTTTLHNSYESWIAYRCNLLTGLASETTPLVYIRSRTQRDLRTKSDHTRHLASN
ncbi:MAG: hypothetical protein ACPG7F_01720 [Aggregatilineales bacterium]